jgi:hypothetical protein
VFKWFKYLTALPALVSLVGELLQLVRNAEDLLVGGDKGAAKRQLVLTILDTAIGLGQKIGIPEADKIDRTALKTSAGEVIDTLVAVLNATGVFKHTTPAAG